LNSTVLSSFSVAYVSTSIVHTFVIGSILTTLFSTFSDASGNGGAGGYLWNSDLVEDRDGDIRAADASANVDCTGDCTVYAWTNTTAGRRYSQSGGGIKSESRGMKLL
jgi:hypothetical protein